MSLMNLARNLNPTRNSMNQLVVATCSGIGLLESFHATPCDLGLSPLIRHAVCRGIFAFALIRNKTSGHSDSQALRPTILLDTIEFCHFRALCPTTVC